MSIFDTVLERQDTDSAKWGAQSPDILPLWVADMDFAAPKPVIDAMAERLKHPVFGYTRPDDSVYQAIIDHYRLNHQATVKKEWIVFLPNVNVGVNLACRIAEGQLMMTTPIYSHIYMRLADESKKQRTVVPLLCENGYYSMDFQTMEQKANDEHIGVFILCNPHNPVGRVYTRSELEELLVFAQRHDILVVSDEIHSDLVLSGHHVPFFSLGEAAQERSIALHSPSKTYNIPGVPIGFAIIPNEKLRAEFAHQSYGLLPGLSAFALAALKAAFTDCETWRQELIAYLQENQKYLRKRVASIDGLSLKAENEATYLAWVDASGIGVEHPYRFLLEQARVRLGDGAEFSDKQFVRINFGCPRSILEEAFDRIEQALELTI
ncbi:PatB family C-S lyase [Oscillibacter sp.]|uniref:MalY/PatB family protein n=1 Tax=Oscillibacter sp. TaxID=1945593 RepID=UPI002897E8E3|nr:PatB family C-S lyase [Oscillibacter sp.]